MELGVEDQALVHTGGGATKTLKRSGGLRPPVADEWGPGVTERGRNNLKEEEESGGGDGCSGSSQVKTKKHFRKGMVAD